jgi:hypothetical protein
MFEHVKLTDCWDTTLRSLGGRYHSCEESYHQVTRRKTPEYCNLEAVVGTSTLIFRFVYVDGCMYVMILRAGLVWYYN